MLLLLELATELNEFAPEIAVRVLTPPMLETV